MTTGLASMIMIIVFSQKLRQLNKKLLVRSAIMAACVDVSMVCVKMGLEQLPASTTSFITSLNIVFVLVLLWFMKKKPSKNNVLGIVFIVIGLALQDIFPGEWGDFRDSGSAHRRKDGSWRQFACPSSKRP
jgi:drug/metabolite transporter (DMT)-like permease